MTPPIKEVKGFKKNSGVTIVMTVNSSMDRAFNYIVPVNLTHIFRGNVVIPAIIDASVKQGWNKAGLERTVYFSDKSTDFFARIVVK